MPKRNCIRVGRLVAPCAVLWLDRMTAGCQGDLYAWPINGQPTSLTLQLRDLADPPIPRAAIQALYHYTSLGSLMRIVEGTYLRATEIRFFSDSAELEYTARLLDGAINRRADPNDELVWSALSSSGAG